MHLFVSLSFTVHSCVWMVNPDQNSGAWEGSLTHSCFTVFPMNIPPATVCSGKWSAICTHIVPTRVHSNLGSVCFRKIDLKKMINHIPCTASLIYILKSLQLLCKKKMFHMFFWFTCLTLSFVMICKLIDKYSSNTSWKYRRGRYGEKQCVGIVCVILIWALEIFLRY